MPGTVTRPPQAWPDYSEASPLVFRSFLTLTTPRNQLVNHTYQRSIAIFIKTTDVYDCTATRYDRNTSCYDRALRLPQDLNLFNH